MADELARWLEKLGLGKYAEILAAHEVSVRDLPHLTEDDLKGLGLPLGPRRRLLAAVKSSNEFSASTQPKDSPAFEPQLGHILRGSADGIENHLDNGVAWIRIAPHKDTKRIKSFVFEWPDAKGIDSKIMNTPFDLRALCSGGFEEFPAIGAMGPWPKKLPRIHSSIVFIFIWRASKNSCSPLLRM